MDRRTFLFVASLGALSAPLAAEAQPAGKVYRVGYLSGSSSTDRRYLIEAFRQGLREVGWVEGQNIVIEYRWAEGRFDRLADLAAELVRLKVDIIVAGPSPPAAAAIDLCVSNGKPTAMVRTEDLTHARRNGACRESAGLDGYFRAA